MLKDTQGFISLESYAPIMDVNLDVYAELDRRIVSFREMVGLKVDSLVPLSRPSGEDIDLYVGQVLLGSGEILVVDGKLAVRVADLREKPTAPSNAAPSQAAE
jgi:flagellar motor switch protein FliN/FliY